MTRDFEERLRGSDPIAWVYRAVGIDGETTSKEPSLWVQTSDPKDFEPVEGGYIYEVVPLTPEPAFISKIDRG